MDKTDKRERIIKAAASIFAADGLERARVEDIADEAGVGKGTIYLYFIDKEQILEEGIRYFAQIRIKQLERLLSKFRSPSKKLSVLLNLSIKIAERNPKIFFMNYAALLSTHKDLRERAVREFFTGYLELVEGILKEGMAAGAFRRLNARVVALSIVLTQDIGNLLFGKGVYKVRSEEVAMELVKMISK